MFNRFNKLSFIIGIFFLLSSKAELQELHFSQYWHTPTMLNPALTGQFKGTFRINGIYRRQSPFSSNVDAFNSIGLNVDIPAIRGFGKKDWIGVGLALGSDSSGDIPLKMSIAGLGLSYHLSFDKKQTSILSIGGQYMTGGLSFGDGYNPKSLRLGTASTLFDQWRTSGAGGQDIEGGSLSDLQVGINYNKRSKKSTTNFGFAVDGILSPNRGTERIDEKSIGINAYIDYAHTISKRTSFQHGILYYKQGTASAFNINSRMFYQINPNKEMRLISGLGIRSFRSAIIYLGIDFKKIQIGLAYDIELSDANNINNLSHSLELGITYKGIVSKVPKPNPIIYCPRL